MLVDMAPTMKFLDDIGVDPETLRKLEELLASSSEAIRASEPDGVAAGAPGGSPAGAELATHSRLAHQVIIEALTELTEELEHYRLGVRDFTRVITETDDEAAAQLDRALVVTLKTEDGS